MKRLTLSNEDFDDLRMRLVSELAAQKDQMRQTAKRGKEICVPDLEEGWRMQVERTEALLKAVNHAENI
jgi:hypothetical protein